MEGVTAVVAVREGSRRLKDKNIRPFGESNLLIHKLRQLKSVNGIDNIVVSSDSERMLEMAKKEGVKIHKRQAEYCDERTKTMGEVIQYVCQNIEGVHIAWTPCTAPLISVETYEAAIKKYFWALENKYDSLVSVAVLKEFILDDNGPVNYELGVNQVCSQDLKPLYADRGGIMMAPRIKMIEWKYNYGSKPYLFKLDKKECLDINDELDLECAKAWLNLVDEAD